MFQALAYWLPQLAAFARRESKGYCRLSGREQLPPEGPCIILTNRHAPQFSPLLALTLFPRLLHTVASSRSSSPDAAAIIEAQRLLRQGHAIAIAQGTPGAALLALRTGATVVPCAVTRSPSAPRPHVLQLGEPIPVPLRLAPAPEHLQDLTRRLGAALRELEREPAPQPTPRRRTTTLHLVR